MMEIKMRRDKVDIANPAEREKYLDDFLIKIKNSKYVKYYTRLVKSYRDKKPKENELLGTIRKMDAAIYQQNKPKEHHFLLKPNY